MENEDGQLRAKENIYSKNSKIDKKFNKKRFIKFFINFRIFTVYIFLRSKLSVLVFHNNFKLSSRGLDCESFWILLAQHLCWLEAF